MHILVVDDHDFTRSMTVRLLHDIGQTDIAECRDGAEALASARAQRPDIVLTDLNMPGMDGMTFIRQLAKQKLTDSLIILSGLELSVLRAVESLAVVSGLRVLGAVAKPFRKDALASMLHAHSHPLSASGSAGDIDLAGLERGIAMEEFKAWYVPILDVKSLRTVALEAVPRWESREYGTLMGLNALAPVNRLAAAPEAAKQVVRDAMLGAALWRQMGWRGTVIVPLGLGALRDESLLDWIHAQARINGISGHVFAIALEGAAFTEDAGTAAFALARALMNEFAVIVHLRTPEDLAAMNLLTTSSTITCPASWVSDPVLLHRVHECASRTRAVVGVTNVDEARLFDAMHEARIHLVQGTAVGEPAGAAETYETHLRVSG